MHSIDYDALIIGGGFYGCMIALYLRNYVENVVIIEKESDLLTRASYTNQARVHNGYHYPRNFITALRSSINFPRFNVEFNKCIDSSFEKIYPIARHNSKVNSNQFYKFCKEIGAPIKIASDRTKKLFNEDLIEEVFLVKEFAFNAAILRTMLLSQLEEANVTILTNTEVEKLEQQDKDTINVILTNDNSIKTSSVFNCTYSQINTVLHKSNIPLLPLKHEVTEMALIKVPEELEHVGITLMDGPFFSTMPFPDRNLHSISHVRYTPHYTWSDGEHYQDAHKLLQGLDLTSKYLFMIKDAQRYIPCLKDAQYVDSLYEVKTVLIDNERDDGRPILFRKDYGIKNFSVVMGGKIDNIYDIIDTMKNIK